MTIIVDGAPSKKVDNVVDQPYTDNEPSSSSEPPPQFSEIVQSGHVTINVDPTLSGTNPEQLPPPPFTPYEAEYFEDHNRNIVSHDKHLNEDGEALYRFLLTKSAAYPRVTVYIHGEHDETHTRLVTSHHNGHTRTRRETRTERVVDFDFNIPLNDCLNAGPFHFSLGDSEPAYRGGMTKTVDAYIEGHRSNIKPSPEVEKKSKQWAEYRRKCGVAPWIGAPEGWESGDYPTSIEGESHKLNDAMVLKSSKSLREWADDYCASNKYLKEFVYAKVPYGWNFNALESAIENIISSTRYEGKYTVKFKTTSSHIFIRPSNTLSRTLSNRWLLVLLWILLIYPFVWLFKRFHSQGGGRWEVCGGGYAFKRWAHLEDSRPGELLHQYAAKKGMNLDSDVGRLTVTPEGLSMVVGVREGEWFRKWQATIRECTLNRVKRSDPIVIPSETLSSMAGVGLDGI